MYIYVYYIGTFMMQKAKFRLKSQYLCGPEHLVCKIKSSMLFLKIPFKIYLYHILAVLLVFLNYICIFSVCVGAHIPEDKLNWRSCFFPSTLWVQVSKLGCWACYQVMWSPKQSHQAGSLIFFFLKEKPKITWIFFSIILYELCIFVLIVYVCDLF